MFKRLPRSLEYAAIIAWRGSFKPTNQVLFDGQVAWGGYSLAKAINLRLRKLAK